MTVERRIKIGVSQFTGGVTQQVGFFDGLPKEALSLRGSKKHFKRYDGYHGTLHPTLASIFFLLTHGSPFLKKAERTAETLLMHSPEQTLAEAGKQGRDVYVLFHPESAAYVLDRFRKGQILIPGNVFIAIKNDEGVSRALYTGELDPCSPRTVAVLAREFTRAGLNRVKKVLDVEHAFASGMVDLQNAVREMEGADIVYLSGFLHRGNSLEQIRELIDRVSATEYGNPELVIIEGPVPMIPFIVTRRHMDDILATLKDLTGRDIAFEPPLFFEKYLERVRINRAMPFITETLRNGGTLVDLGCGFYSPFSAYLKNEGTDIDYIGIDRRLSRRKKPSDWLIKANLKAAIPLPDCSTDAVVSLAVIEHIDEIDNFLDEIYRILKPGGRVVVSTPSPKAKKLLEYLSGRGVIDRRQIADHKKYFTLGELKRLFIQNRFRDVMCQPFYLGYNQILTARR